jgi:hypothetical protein
MVSLVHFDLRPCGYEHRSGHRSSRAQFFTSAAAGMMAITRTTKGKITLILVITPLAIFSIHSLLEHIPSNRCARRRNL